MSRAPATALALLLLAGCGSSKPAARRAADPCPAGAVPGRVVARDVSRITCAYPGAQIAVDSAPQAGVRFNREEVELGQNTASGWRQDLARRPQTVFGLGIGAFWVAAEHRLVATDDRVILTTVLSGPDRTRARAVAITRTALGRRRRAR